MARGDLTVFEEFTKSTGSEEHNFSSDVLKLGIVDNTLTPVASMATPTWGDYSAGEVTSAGGYTTGGETLSDVTWTEAAGVATLDASNVSLVQNASGFTDAYWGILYNSTNGTGMAIGFVELDGPVSEQVGPFLVAWHASGILAVNIV